MICQLCSFEFDEKQVNCHASCPFNEHCAVICCPNCGYQSTDESKSRLAAGAKRLLSHFNRPKQDQQIQTTTISEAIATVCRLSLLRQGQRGKVITIDTENAARLERLQVFGLIPGAQVMLERHSPEFVLWVDYTLLTIERTTADNIMIELDCV